MSHQEKKIAIYPGTFDPITLGHIDVVGRATAIFDEVVVVVARNSKKTPLFGEEERIAMAAESLAHLEGVRVQGFHGLVVDCAREIKAISIIRGVRAVTDFEYEFQIALMNRKIYPSISTVFLMPGEKYTYLSSSIVRELARYNQDVSMFVPSPVVEALVHKFGPVK